MPRSVLKIWSGAAHACGAAACCRGAASYSRIYLNGIPASVPWATRPGSAARPFALVAGRAQVGRQTILLGLALWLDQPTALNPVVLEPHQWLDVVRIKSASE